MQSIATVSSEQITIVSLFFKWKATTVTVAIWPLSDIISDDSCVDFDGCGRAVVKVISAPLIPEKRNTKE